jgi:hypothetical protein
MRYARLLGFLVLVAASTTSTACATSRAPADPSAMRLPSGPFGRPAPVMRAAGGHDADELAALRDAGPAGIASLARELDAATDDEARASLRDALDQVAQHRDAWASRLYWYTDLEAAKNAARKEGKPILSLRLLGDLTDELSCANSRFFRAILYPNTDVQKILRERFVLHWSSERPAPVITIDYRDGRKVVRTVTGNSVHYALDAEGRPLDALPGLVGPKAFRGWLDSATALADVARKGGREVLKAHHEQRIRALDVEYRRDLAKMSLPENALPVLLEPDEPEDSGEAPSAAMAMPVAVSKAKVEAPLLGAMGLASPPPSIEAAPWEKLAELHADDARIDEAGRRVLRAKNPHDWSKPANPAPLTEEAFAAMVAQFERSVAEDTAKNLHGLRPFVLRWLEQDPEMTLEQLNARVYGKLFLTPAGDPWLGLVPPRVFSGIAEDGIVVEPR